MLVRYSDGWKELHFIVRHSEFLGYKQARFDDVDSEDGRETEESGDSVDDEESDDSNDSSDSQDDDMIDDTCLLRQPQPGAWQAALEHWERAGLRSRSQPKPQPSVVIYRSTSPTDDAVLEPDTRTRFSQSYGPGQNAKTYGKVKDTALMAPGERDREALVVVKRGSGVDYAEAVRPSILQPEMGSDLRCDTDAWTWDEAKKVAKTTMVGEMRSMYAMQIFGPGPHQPSRSLTNITRTHGFGANMADAEPTIEQSQPEPPQQLTLPPAQLFDILPALHEILARIEHNPQDVANAQSVFADGEIGINYTNLQPLDPKELPAAILPLKAQMRKGLKELEKLPDMDRSVEEQDEEIVELKMKIKRQEEVMREMGRMGEIVKNRLGS
ncbi:hypothetical protein LTR10_003151 [Elasticomyces elasticus]|nr:hypothetical protein LTR10_003151 [Elasticomyces elasticus]KAK4969423.1 hypothetical protein LTR42_008693 [Elasticomyces elasticus]